MRTCLVLVTHNRVAYTQKCVQHVLADSESDFDLHIWDNASSDDTPNYLSSIRDQRLKSLVLSKTNVGQTAAMNQVWGSTDAALVAKLDNDCLVTPGWLRTLGAAHRDIRQLGAVACWHYERSDFNDRVAEHKTREIGRHKIFEHPWVCGSGFVMKRETYLAMGPWPEGSPDISTTGYFLDMALRGYINGWYFPLVLQHHMDDPFSPHCCYHDDESLMRVFDTTYTLRVHHLDTMSKRLKRRERVLRTLLYGSRQASDYVGWRRRFRRWLPDYDVWRWRILHPGT